MNPRVINVNKGKFVEPYQRKVKDLSYRYRFADSINGILKIENGEITCLVINEDSRKFDSKYKIEGSKKSGKVYVSQIKPDEIKEIENGYIPQMWVEVLKNKEMLEDNDMVEMKDVKKTKEVATGGEVVENKGEVDMVEAKEAVVCEEVVKAQVEEEMVETEDGKETKVVDEGAKPEIEMKEISLDEENALSDDEKNALLDTTHPITETDKFVIVCYCDGHRIELQVVVREDSKIMDGAHFYLVNDKTGKRHIGAKGCLKFAADKITNAKNYEIMNFLNNFDLKITEDDLKVAFDRSKNYILISKEKMNDGEVDVVTAFEWFKDLVIDRAKEEVRLGYKERHYKYDEKEGTVQVKAENFQKTLDDAGTNFRRIPFCKALRMVENSTGKKFIECNRSAGYGFNDSKNEPWFKFNIGSIA